MFKILKGEFSRLFTLPLKCLSSHRNCPLEQLEMVDINTVHLLVAHHMASVYSHVGCRAAVPLLDLAFINHSWSSGVTLTGSS